MLDENGVKISWPSLCERQYRFFLRWGHKIAQCWMVWSLPQGWGNFVCVKCVTSTEMFSEWPWLLCLEYQVSNQGIFFCQILTGEAKWKSSILPTKLHWKKLTLCGGLSNRWCLLMWLYFGWSTRSHNQWSIYYNHTSLLELMANAMGMVQHLCIHCR